MVTSQNLHNDSAEPVVVVFFQNKWMYLIFYLIGRALGFCLALICF